LDRRTITPSNIICSNNITQQSLNITNLSVSWH